MVEVSIIIPVYNREKLLSRAIRSCLNQDIEREKIEIIVINDGSTDNSENEIKKFFNEIIYVEHKKNLGLPNARNTGIKEAKGRYIFNVDSDDFIHPKTISTLLIAAELMPSYSCITCDYVLTDDNDNKSEIISFVDSPIACGILFKRQVLFDLGLYDEDFKINEEKDLWTRLLQKKYKIKNIEIPFYRYYKHNDNITSSEEKKDYDKKLKLKHGNL